MIFFCFYRGACNKGCILTKLQFLTRHWTFLLKIFRGYSTQSNKCLGSICILFTQNSKCKLQCRLFCFNKWRHTYIHKEYLYSAKEQKSHNAPRSQLHASPNKYVFSFCLKMRNVKRGNEKTWLAVIIYGKSFIVYSLQISSIIHVLSNLEILARNYYETHSVNV